MQLFGLRKALSKVTAASVNRGCSRWAWLIYAAVVVCCICPLLFFFFKWRRDKEAREEGFGGTSQYCLSVHLVTTFPMHAWDEFHFLRHIRSIVFCLNCVFSCPSCLPRSHPACSSFPPLLLASSLYVQSWQSMRAIACVEKS